MRRDHVIAAYVLAFIMVALVTVMPAQAPVRLANLTKLSDREWVDLSKVTYVQLPVYIPVPGCVDCASRWGAGLVVDGVRLEYSEEAEVEIRRLLK